MAWCFWVFQWVLYKGSGSGHINQHKKELLLYFNDDWHYPAHCCCCCSPSRTTWLAFPFKSLLLPDSSDFSSSEIKWQERVLGFGSERRAARRRHFTWNKIRIPLVCFHVCPDWKRFCQMWWCDCLIHAWESRLSWNNITAAPEGILLENNPGCFMLGRHGFTLPLNIWNEWLHNGESRMQGPYS